MTPETKDVVVDHLYRCLALWRHSRDEDSVSHRRVLFRTNDEVREQETKNYKELKQKYAQVLQ